MRRCSESVRRRHSRESAPDSRGPGGLARGRIEPAHATPHQPRHNVKLSPSRSTRIWRRRGMITQPGIRARSTTLLPPPRTVTSSPFGGRVCQSRARRLLGDGTGEELGARRQAQCIQSLQLDVAAQHYHAILHQSETRQIDSRLVPRSARSRHRMLPSRCDAPHISNSRARLEQHGEAPIARAGAHAESTR